MAVTKKTLSEKDLSEPKLAAWIKELADAADLETTEIVEKMQERFTVYVDMKELKNAPMDMIVQRVKNAVTEHFKGAKNLDSFHGYLDAPTQEAKDWSAADIKAIMDEAKTPQAVLSLMAAGKIASVIEMEDGKPVQKPVRKLLVPMKKGKDKEWHVVQELIEKGVHRKAYELWEKPGDPVVPLDTNEFLKDGSTENFSFGGELKPNWGINIVGTMFPRKEAAEYCPRRATIQVYGPLADPNEKDNILKTLLDKNLLGIPVLFKGVLNEKKTTEGMFTIGVRKRYTCQPLKDVPAGTSLLSSIDAWTGNVEYTGDPFDVFEDKKPGKITAEMSAVLEETYAKGMMAVYKHGTNVRVDISAADAEKANEKAKKASKPTPIPYAIRQLPFTRVSMSSLREWHEKFQSTTDDFKVIFKKKADDSEYQPKNYSRFAALECSGRPADAPAEGQSIRLMIMDSAAPNVKMSVFLPRHITSLPFSGLADLKMIVQTRKKNEYFDKEAKTMVGDGDGRFGDIQADVYSLMVTFVHPPDKDEDDGEDVPGSGGIEKKVKLLEEKPDV
jgi:hypothetical protein